MSSQKNAYAARLREIMSGMTVRAFSERIGKSASTVQEYLKGRVPPADFVQVVCEKFEISESWFLSGEGPKRKNANTNETVTETETPYINAVLSLRGIELRLLNAFREQDEEMQKNTVQQLEYVALGLRELREKGRREKSLGEESSAQKSNG